ncbi:hypothetical protein PIB30_089243, partial [Stylosanthes scabra]|nr:hypothetical protein [Stylosanthes scabra]
MRKRYDEGNKELTSNCAREFNLLSFGELFARKYLEANAQTLHLPCRHMLAACSHARLDWKQYVHHVYRIESMLQVRHTRRTCTVAFAGTYTSEGTE